MKQVLINAGFHTRVLRLQDDVIRDIKNTWMLLWGGVLFVLLIGAVNIANLVLARSSARTRELATRFALGAGKWRVARQLLREGILILAIGLGLGLSGALALAQYVQSLLYGVRPLEPAVLAPVFLVLALVTLAACSIPAQRATRVDPITALRCE